MVNEEELAALERTRAAAEKANVAALKILRKAEGEAGVYLTPATYEKMPDLGAARSAWLETHREWIDAEDQVRKAKAS
jgi:hypothetical protein